MKKFSVVLKKARQALGFVSNRQFTHFLNEKGFEVHERTIDKWIKGEMEPSEEKKNSLFNILTEGIENRAEGKPLVEESVRRRFNFTDPPKEIRKKGFTSVGIFGSSITSTFPFDQEGLRSGKKCRKCNRELYVTGRFSFDLKDDEHACSNLECGAVYWLKDPGYTKKAKS